MKAAYFQSSEVLLRGLERYVVEIENPHDEESWLRFYAWFDENYPGQMKRIEVPVDPTTN